MEPIHSQNIEKNTCEIVSPSKIIEDCLSINFPGYPENFPDHQKNIKSIRKLSRLSKNLTDHPENIQIIQKLSSLSGNFPGYPEIFRIIRKISSLSGNYLKGPETSQCNFKGYAQKLSGRAKTFRVAMPPCHPGFCASGQQGQHSSSTWLKGSPGQLCGRAMSSG